MDKFIVNRKPFAKSGFQNVSIRYATYLKIKAMADDAGLKITDLIDEMTNFCIERVEYKDFASGDVDEFLRRYLDKRGLTVKDIEDR